MLVAWPDGVAWRQRGQPLRADTLESRVGPDTPHIEAPLRQFHEDRRIGVGTVPDDDQVLFAFQDRAQPLAQDRVIVMTHGVAGKVIRGLYTGEPMAQALAVDSPQDGFFILNDGRVTRQMCEMV